ncbi:hypothetical protein ACFOVU_13985 [Nocardiopsis sediminis]|uniref:Uncharacterized protein n=1 Tax=Nocardiopsis sediminis TaxID=1778267 RepID=A0ABV8FMG3_9ACTN
MKRTSIRRIAFVSVAAPALVVGGPALAMADTVFSSETEAAGPHGAASHEIFAAAFEKEHGEEKGKDEGHREGKGEEHGEKEKEGVIFKESAEAAGKHGAVSTSTISKAN